ncbi:hypothetical protein PR048_030017 [Dryococelus australis]|uniref:Uncharacterized protein n=1 Tax=Dryococelus australis TaxID=614101 RepID=A0ABQ9G7R7_9NEOP|nr:hypothetical protein PR048_030017 [Dryococelus australis]
MSAYTRQKAKSKYRNSIRLERASQKQSNGTHKPPYNRVKRCRGRKRNIKASERVNWGRSIPVAREPDSGVVVSQWVENPIDRGHRIGEGSSSCRNGRGVRGRIGSWVAVLCKKRWKGGGDQEKGGREKKKNSNGKRSNERKFLKFEVFEPQIVSPPFLLDMLAGKQFIAGTRRLIVRSQRDRAT